MVFSILLIILGLSLFETVSSLDNAIINAEVLSTMSPKGKRWFLTWGVLIAVFVVRGLFPFLIIWIFNTRLSIWQIISAAWSTNPIVFNSIHKSAPILLALGGVFLIFLFLHWLFLEDKKFGLNFSSKSIFGNIEEFFSSKGMWFYVVSFIALMCIAYFAFEKSLLMGYGTFAGAGLFFIVQGFKQHAEVEEEKFAESRSIRSDFSKLLFLEVIDSTFSIDGVLGAFAFTFSLPLILLGNGLGAFLVRQLTVSNIERIKKYVYLKNGAMYSILALGIIMILHSFEIHVPEYVSPVATFVIIGFFFWRSKMALKSKFAPEKT